MTKPRTPFRNALAAAKRETIDAAMRALPTEASIGLQYYRVFRRFPDLRNPQRFTEKLQVLKLYGGLEAHSDWADKIIAKDRVAAILGDSWITPTLWHGKTLPPREERTWPTPYVIKANHGSGWCHHVVTDADKDWDAIEAMCAAWLRQKWHPHLHERQYQNIEPQILVEPRLGGTAAIIPYDYKFRVFHGRVEQVGVSTDRLQGTKIALFDRDWNRLPFAVDYIPMETAPLEKPPHFDEMLRAAERLARPFPHFVRVDFYDLPEGPRFGEITLTPASGLRPYDPDAWDLRTGALLDVSDLIPQRSSHPPTAR